MFLFESFYFHYEWTYNEAFAMDFVRRFLIRGFFFILASYIIYLLGVFIRDRTKKKDVSDLSERFLNDERVDISSPYKDIQEYVQKENASRKDKGYRVYQLLYLASAAASWVGWYFVAVCPAILSGLGVIPMAAGYLLTLFLAVVKYFELVYTYCPECLREDQDRRFTTFKTKFVRFFKRAGITTRLYKWRFGAGIALLASFTFFAPYFLCDTCLNFSNTGYGTKFDGFGSSTRFTRYFQLEKPCPDGKICHMYATLPEDASTSVFINVQTGVDVESITVGYDTLENYQNSPKLSNSVKAASFEAGLEDMGNRYIHTAYLRDLTPSTIYYFEVYYNNQTQGNGTYRTLPSKEMERNIIMIAGGDVGNTDIARKMTATVADYTPDVILVGGDVVYDNGIPACYYSYDLFFKMFEGVNEKAGRLVPLFFNVGNHDVGFNAFQDSTVDITKNNFFLFFPQHSRMDSEGNLLPEVPKPSERVSYNYHTLGKTIQITLDSGYMHDYNGTQLEFLKNTSEKYNDLVKMANYHVPAFPLCFNKGSNDWRTMDHPQQFWQPVFQQYKFASAFENHGHLYKRTYPVLNGAPNPGGEGTIYFGDGNWGMNPDHIIPTLYPGLFETNGTYNHVWIINITKDDITFYAINETNHRLDDPFAVPTSRYLPNSEKW